LSALRKTSIQISDLLEKVRLEHNTEIKILAESRFSDIASNINNELEKVKGGVAHDTVLLEHLKAYATDIGELTSHVAPKLLGVFEKTRLATVEQIEQANAALQEAIRSANDLLASMRATELPCDGAMVLETEKLSMEKFEEELLIKMTSFINETLARDELYIESVECCKNIAIEFTDGTNAIHIRWKTNFSDYMSGV